MRTKLLISIFVIALIGFADASYLTVEHFQGKIPPCSVVEGCERVLTSSYSVVAGIPVSLAGSIYYLLVLIGLFAYFDTKNESILKWTLHLTALGFLASLAFLYLQAFVIHSYCLYCLGSIATSTAIFAIALFVMKRYSIVHE